MKNIKKRENENMKKSLGFVVPDNPDVIDNEMYAVIYIESDTPLLVCVAICEDEIYKAEPLGALPPKGFEDYISCNHDLIVDEIKNFDAY